MFLLGLPQNTLLAKNKLWYQKGKVTAVKHSMFVSHHSILQVHLGPTGEEQLYNSSMTTVTGQHEGSPAILRNTMRQNSTVTVMNMKTQLNMDNMYTYFTQSCPAEFSILFTINCVMVYILSCSTI